MIATFLPDKLTPATPRELIDALRIAFIELEGVPPTPQCLALHTAQAMLESGRLRSCHNNCITNAKASSTYQGYFSCYRCNEKLGGRWVYFVPEGELVGGFGTPLKGPPLAVPDGHPQTRFRAFRTLADGALDHMVLEKRKFPEAYTAARAGDDVGFVHGLKIRTFFTADEAPYLKGVQGLQREFLPLCIDASADHVEQVSDEEICQGLACVAPDPDRYLHTEAVLAAMTSMDGVWDAIRNERNAALRGDDEPPSGNGAA